MDLNHRSSAYEADEIPLLYPATVKVSVYLFPQRATECYCSSSSWILSRQRSAHNTYTERLVRRLLFMLFKNGALCRIRTDHLRITSALLYQMS